jgi:hypothetical protein
LYGHVSEVDCLPLKFQDFIRCQQFLVFQTHSFRPQVKIWSWALKAWLTSEPLILEFKLCIQLV